MKRIHSAIHSKRFPANTVVVGEKSTKKVVKNRYESKFANVVERCSQAERASIGRVLIFCFILGVIAGILIK